MSKGKRKSKRRAQEDPPLVQDQEQLEPEEIAEAGHKDLLELTADELKKEAFKLGLYVEGDKPRKDQALTKLTAFLSRSGINIETFKFSPNGTTTFPAPLLSQNRARTANARRSSSSSDTSSGSGSEAEEASSARTPPVPSVLRKKKKSKTNKTSTNSGYETLVNPVTGVPVGIVSKTTGQFFNVAVHGSAPVTTIPPNPNSSQATSAQPAPGHGGLTGLATVGLGAHATSTFQSSAADTATTDTGMQSNANLDICGISIPGFAQNKSQHGGSNCTKKLTSGMFCTGKKEVRQKIVWPHHCVNSIIKPNGVEYDVMNWQELTNGFTGLILSKMNNETIQPEIVNMIRHLNLISGYGMFAPIKTVLDFNAGLMMGIENMSQDWFNWARLKQYHDQHLHSLKLSANFSDADAASPKSSPVVNGSDSTTNGGGPSGNQRCSKAWLASQNVCFLYQNDKCDQELSHDDGKGNTICHCCGWCYFNWKGILEHSNATCPDKKNPFRVSRLGNSRAQTGKKPGQ